MSAFLLISIDSLLDIANELEDLTSEWREVGLHLGITNSKIYEITTASASTGCTLHYTKICLVETWLKVCADPTWSMLADALDKAKVPLIANRIRQKYVISSGDDCKIRNRDHSTSIKVKNAKSRLSSLKRNSVSCFNSAEQEIQEYCTETKHQLQEQCTSLQARLKQENDDIQKQIAKIEEMIQKVFEERNALLEQLDKSMCGLHAGTIQALKPAKKIAEGNRIEKLQEDISNVKNEIEALNHLLLKTGLAHNGDSNKLVEQLTIAICHLDMSTLEEEITAEI